MAPREPEADPARLLSLLWRDHQPQRPRRGPRPARSVDDIVGAATSLADDGGLDALTVRAVAGAVGASPMSLYTYVSGRSELLDLMVDALYDAMPRPPLYTEAWPDRLHIVADANLSLVKAHPWLASASQTRPPLGPGVMAKYEHELSAFDGLGLDDVTVDDCLTLLLTFVNGVGRAWLHARNTEQHSGLSDKQWWAANAPLLERVFDPLAYPRAARIGTAAGTANNSGYNPERAYQFGLDRIRDSIAALIIPSMP